MEPYIRPSNLDDIGEEDEDSESSDSMPSDSEFGEDDGGASVTGTNRSTMSSAMASSSGANTYSARSLNGGVQVGNSSFSAASSTGNGTYKYGTPRVLSSRQSETSTSTPRGTQWGKPRKVY